MLSRLSPTFGSCYTAQVRLRVSGFLPGPQLPTTRGEKVTIWVLGTALGSLFVAELLSNFTRDRLSMLFVLLAWGPMLVLHEAAHAIVARALGWSVSEVVIGFGRDIFAFRVGATLVRVKSLPVEGYVVPTPQNLRHVGLKSALVYAAGPGAELLFVALAWLWVGPELLQRGGSISVLAWQSAALAATLGALFNLVPYSSGHGMSDGLGIFMSLMVKPEQFAVRLAVPALRRIRDAVHGERYAAARAAAELMQERFPGDVRALAYLAVCQAAEGAQGDALDALEALGHPDDQASEVRNEMLLCAAWAVLLGTDNTLLHQAEHACRRVLERDPQSALALLLLGRVQLRRGREADAVQALLTGYSYARDRTEEAQFAAYLLLGALASGDTNLVDRFAPLADQLSLGPRLRTELGLALEARSAV